jgi:tetratricopeptide (TPR) repeat protein
VAGFVTAMLVAVSAWWWMAGGSREDAGQLLRNAQAARAAGDLSRAEQLAARAWGSAAARPSAALLASDCAAEQGAWDRAVGYLQDVSATDPELQRQIALKRATLNHLHRHRLAEAERDYRAVLTIDAHNGDAHSGLVQLLCLCGRKREAIPHILHLIRQGEELDLLLLLARPDMVVNDREALEQARRADPADPNPLVGLAWHALNEEQFAEAEQLLQSALKRQPGHVPALILQGRLLLAAGRPAEYATWAAQLPTSADVSGEVWSLRGHMAEELDDQAAAVRCYWESLRREPESRPATYRLAHLLAATDDAALAEPFRERVQRLHELEETQSRVLFAADHGRPELLLPLARSYAAAGRLWEAFGWCQFAREIGVDTAELRRYTDELDRRLQQEPLQLVTDSANPALAVDLSRYPLPQYRTIATPSTADAATVPSTPAFRDDAAAVGLEFRYFNGVAGPPTRRMFEFTGGGVGVLDYDLDGFPDLFFTQGCSWPPGSADPSGGDRLFRNRGGERFEEVSQRSRIREHGFGQGVAVGDFNNDGFPDLYVANIGGNVLWLNHGDGTFSDATTAAGLHGDAWTTSAVLADLSGDGLPDLYDVNYVTAPDVFDRVCRATDGAPMLCMPFDFHGQPDRFWLNLGDGRFREATTEFLGETPRGMGLGAAVWDADGQGRLSLFVANDTTPALLFRPDPDTGKHREAGIEAGLAFNGAGKATACMGVALGDVDSDGRLDLHITNFYAEPNTLFLNVSPGVYIDQTRRLGLETPSLNVLGFGTQFLDANLDGRLELFVANGHVDDLSRLNRPYRMRPQLFRWDTSQRFRELPAAALGPYFEQEWLGRPAARLDWNRDGRDDLIVGHLHDNVALLTNVTGEVGGHVSLRLFGVQSSRDAVGAIVEARIGPQTLVRQITAGDGYQASNERRMIFGLGRSVQIDELMVRWPSGLQQRLSAIPKNTELWLREGAPPMPANGRSESGQ